jgi:hypothetical protein
MPHFFVSARRRLPSASITMSAPLVRNAMRDPSGDHDRNLPVLLMRTFDRPSGSRTHRPFVPRRYLMVVQASRPRRDHPMSLT